LISLGSAWVIEEEEHDLKRRITVKDDSGGKDWMRL
jgi:hypothetical protein